MEYKRKAILARDIKSLSLTQVREQAQSLWLLDSKKYNAFLKTEWLITKNSENISSISEQNNSWDQENSLENPQEEILETQNIWEKKYVVMIPSTAKKEDLLDLKNFMWELPKWEIQIFINLRGQEIDTKMSLLSTSELKIWEGKTFK
jgi:hypothetical protein